MNYVVLANSFVSRAAKCGALLRFVQEEKKVPSNLDAATSQVWDAMVFVGLVQSHDNGHAWLSEGGKALAELANKGEF